MFMNMMESTDSLDEPPIISFQMADWSLRLG